MVWLMVISKRVYTNGDFPKLLLAPPSLWRAPADPRLHRRPSNTSRQFWFSLLWSHCSFPLSLGACKILFVPSKAGVPISPSGSLVVKSLWPSRSDSLGIPRHFVRSPGWEAWCGVQNLNKSGKTSLVLLFFNLSPTRWTWDLIIVILPLLLSHCGSFFVFGRGVSFFGGFWGPPVGGCSLFNS